MSIAYRETSSVIGRARVNFLTALLSLFLAGCGGGSPNADSTEIATDDASELSEFQLRTGAYVGNPALSMAVVGKEYAATLGVAAVDQRNQITQLDISNPTAGGAVPTIDISGNIRWTPNQVDFDSTSVLKLTVSLKIGQAALLDLPTMVQKEKIVFQSSLGANDASYSDDEGNYIIEAKRRNVTVPIQGTLIVTEFYNKLGLLRWAIATEGSNETVNLEVLAASTAVAQAPVTALATQAAYPLRQLDFSATEFKDLPVNGKLLAENGTNIVTVRIDQNGYGYNHGNPTISAAPHKALNYFFSCSSKQSCDNAANVRAPVVLIHGFSGGDNAGFNNDMVGGGVGTWGGLPQLLIDKGHPVFEMQWHTYMRFEEAAGALAKFTFAVARYTGKKPIVIAHSFGGVVAHLALESEGIEPDGARWRPVNYQSQISRLVTLNSPLSGINHPTYGLDRSDFISNKISSVDGSIFSMTRGRDHTDRLIGECYSITCLQAGALFSPTSISGDGLKLRAALIAGYGDEIVYESTTRSPAAPKYEFTRGKNRTPWEGESIKRLQDGASRISVPVLRFVGFQNLHQAKPNKLHGDGLISLVGQALFPGHLTNDPFNANANFGYKFVDSSVVFPLYHVGGSGSLQGKTFSKLEAGDCFKYKVDVFPYVICARSAHTGDDSSEAGGLDFFTKRFQGSEPANLDFSIANYGNEDYGVRHPLLTLVEDEEWLKIVPESYDGCSVQPRPLVCTPSTSTYKGRAIYGTTAPLALQADNPARSVATFMRLANKATGAVRNDFQGYYADDNGQFEIDVSAAITDRFGADAKINEYRLSLTIKVVGFEPYAAAFEDIGSGTINLGTITLNPLGAKVSFAGVVLDAQTAGTGIAGATVRLAQGRDLDAATIMQRSDVANSSSVLTARKTTTDSVGGFSVAGLRAGEYTVLVTKTGYADKLQGRVIVASGQTAAQVIVMGAPSIELPATSFVRGENVALSANGYGADTLMNAPPYQSVTNAAEWDFAVPATGSYELFAEYAAAESRPVTISFNGSVKFGVALSTVTGGWFPANRQVLSQGVVQLTAGLATMRVSRADVFPHIKAFRLVPTQAVAQGLVGHWSFDNCNGNDTSLMANHGTVTGAPVCVPGKVGNALRFNGSSDWIVVPSSASFPKNAITLSYWIHRENNAVGATLQNYLSKDLAFQSYLMSDGALTAGLWLGTPGYWSQYGGVSTTPLPTLTDWVHFAFTYENITRRAKLYVNGVLASDAVDADANALVRESSNPLFLGRNGSANVYHIRGLLDEVRIYDRALSSQEVGRLFSSGG